MTDDLKKRLRERKICTGFQVDRERHVMESVYGPDALCHEAADRIAELESAMQDFNDALIRHGFGKTSDKALPGEYDNFAALLPLVERGGQHD